MPLYQSAPPCLRKLLTHNRKCLSCSILCPAHCKGLTLAWKSAQLVCHWPLLADKCPDAALLTAASCHTSAGWWAHTCLDQGLVACQLGLCNTQLIGIAHAACMLAVQKNMLTQLWVQHNVCMTEFVLEMAWTFSPCFSCRSTI